MERVPTELTADGAVHPARARLLDFAQHAYPGFHIARHHEAIAEGLEAVERGDIDRLIIEAPPRHGKSLLTSTLFPCWYMGRNPNNRVIACSYSADLAHTFSRQVRNQITTPEFQEVFPEVQIASDARSVGMWELEHPHRGGYVSAGVGGSITGKGAHLLLIDDPLKSPEAAASAAILQSQWDWYVGGAYTRLEGRGAVVLIMTRWAENDLTGRLLEEMRTNPEADRWHIIHLPALAEADDQLGREIDEALWPEKFSTAMLKGIRAVQGSRHFAALYQQRPAPAEGSIFKRDWWQRYSHFDRSQARQVIQCWDTAFKAKTSNDYSVCATWALADNCAYLLDLVRRRMEFPELKRCAAEQAAKWKPAYILIEDKASGQSLIQEFRSGDGKSKGLNVIPFDPKDADKVARAHAVTPYIEGRRVFIPEDSVPWVRDFVEEHAAFDNGAFDDQVDTTTMALLRLFGNPLTIAGPGGVSRSSPWRS